MTVVAILYALLLPAAYALGHHDARRWARMRNEIAKMMSGQSKPPSDKTT